MATDLANLALRIEYQSAEEANEALDRLVEAGSRAEQAMGGVASGSQSADERLGKVGESADRASRGLTRVFSDADRTAGSFNSMEAQAQRLEQRLDGQFEQLEREVAGAEAEMAQINSRMGQTAEVADRTDAAFGRLSPTVEGLARRAAGLITFAAVAQQMTAAAQAAIRLESSLASVSAVTGATGPQLAVLREEMFALSSGTLFAANEISQAYAQIAADADGLADSPAQLSAITQAAITLAEATRSELPSAADAIAQVLRQFQAGPEDAGRFIDILVQLGPTADELGEAVAAMNGAGDAAASLGISVEDTAAALSLLARRGIEGSEAGAGLKMVLSELERETDSRLRPSVVGLSQALQNAEAAGKVFEGRSMAIGATLMAQADQMDSLSERFRENGAAQAAASRATDTTDAAFRRLAASAENFRADFADNLTPSIRGGSEALADLLDRLSGLDEGTAGASTQVDLLGPVIRGVGFVAIGAAGGVEQLGLRIGALGAAAAALAAGDLAGARAVMQDFANDWSRINQQIAEDQAALLAGPQAKIKPPEIDTSGFPQLDLGGLPDGFDLGTFTVEGQVNTPSFGDDVQAETRRQANERILRETRERYRTEREIAQQAADQDIAALEALTGLTLEQENRRGEQVAAIRRNLAEELADIDQRAADEQKRRLDEAARLAEEAERAQLQQAQAQMRARQFLSGADLATTEDPSEQGQIRLEQQLDQMRTNGQELVRQGVLTQEQVDAAVADVAAAGQAALTEQALQAERDRTAAVIQARAAATLDEGEALRLNLEAQLLIRRQHLSEILGDEQAVAQQIAAERAVGLARIEKMEADAAKRQREMDIRANQERVRTMTDVVGGLAALFGANSERIFRIQKASALASAALNIPEAASDAYKWGTKIGGPWAGAAAAAVAVAAEVGNLAAIQSTEFGGGGGYSGGGGGGGSFSAGGSFGSPSSGGRLFDEDSGSGPDRDTRLVSDRFPTFPVADAGGGGAIAIDEPTWSLPELTVETPELRVAPTTLRAETVPQETFREPTVSPLSAYEGRLPQIVVSPLSGGQEQPAGGLEEPRASSLDVPQQPRTLVLQAPSVAPIPQPVRPTSPSPVSVGAPSVSMPVSVTVVNQLGQAAQADVQQESGPSGEQTLRIILSAVAQDIGQDGVISQAMRQRFLMSGQLAVRG